MGLDLQNNLTDMGYRVTSVRAEARPAIDGIAEESPDLVLMDIQLRGSMDGIDAAREINNRFSIPVLFLTAFADSDILDRARKVGAYGYMIKPFSNQELHAMVEVALYKHRTDKEREQLNDRLRRAQKYESLRLMAGGIAHRFNNSMHAVLGNIAFAMEDLPPDSPAMASLKNAKMAATSSAELGAQLLACSGRGFYDLKKLDLTALIKQTIFSHEALLPPSVDLNLDMKRELPYVKIDPEQLELVLVALVTNSIESLKGNQGTITIETSVQDLVKNDLKSLRMGQFLNEGPYVCLSVIDTGCGMDESTIRKVFDPFFSTKFTGRGLGLATTLGVVQAHNGTVKVESDLGSGTTVEILLPVVPSEASA